MATSGDGQGDGQGAALRLRPRRSLLGSGILGLILVPLPIVVTILALGSPDGSWRFALIFGAIAVILFIIGLYLFQTTYILITARQVTEREFFGAPVSTPLSAVHSAVLAHTFRTSSSDTLPQLIVRNDRGERLLRMRGIFWTEESMRAAAAAIGVPLEEPAEALTARQFLEVYSGSAYWFENRRGVVALVVAVGILCIGVVLGLMGLLGLPLNA
ncbi:MAG: hypothetical protein V4531_12490 [Actinomycetota bacterium]